MKDTADFKRMSKEELETWFEKEGPKASEKQRAYGMDIYMQLITGEKKKKSEDILDSRMLYDGSFGCRRG